MDTRSIEELLAYDREHIWHPYASMGHQSVVYPVVSASSVRLNLADGRELIDGISSWWCAIHGYNHPALNEAAITQIRAMSHVMFGGLTHQPARELAALLVDLAPRPLDKVFFCDCGSVSVEVAIKMAVQYWHAIGKKEKTKLITVKSGYHGDTFLAMSVCDPVEGMHQMFQGILPAQTFADAPQCGFDDPWDDRYIKSFERLIREHHQSLAAAILEPIVQGAGGMRFYAPEYLRRVRDLCDRYEVLLICDEIATGFGKTGKLFACEHAGISPDIMCLGKAITGGYMSLAATLTTEKVSDAISNGAPGLFMHGPTFMANPLACAVAVASIRLLLSMPWQDAIRRIEGQLTAELSPCRRLGPVADVRVLGAIGVVELERPVDVVKTVRLCAEQGVWLRPFGKILYTIPPYIISDRDLSRVTGAIHHVVKAGAF
ncbi:MAG: adenosylmethionine--8-amino-7-oxononanoate transaminase [Spirochaetes bacterium RBG_16_49_21]|nr:MAG: adenosylmethionine--8-amino-7-oxononanoate transaminase [Spirochaetes bacterium RBG_16_49_21]